MKFKYIRPLALLCSFTLALSGCGAAAGSAGSTAADVETGEEEVADKDAYADFEAETHAVSQDAPLNPSGLVGEYGHTSSYDLPRETKGDKVRSYLSGKWVDKEKGERRPVAIMLNNIKEAQPMSGVSRADVLYECVVEGGLTRMMGLFEDYDDLDKIGSVRSCRNYFVYYALEFDAIYCHYGQSAYAMPLLKQDFVDNLSGLSSEGDIVYYRSTDRVAPHNAYASAKGIKKGIEVMGYDPKYRPGYRGKFTFAYDGETIVPDSADSYSAVHVEPGYLINKPWFEYNADDGKYYRYEYEEPQIDGETEEQLAVDNIILQYSSWERVDDKDYLGFDCHMGGMMTYVTHGKARDGIWMRFDGDEGAVRYFDSEGKEIVLNQGKTWVLIIQDTMGDKVVVR
ncbi:MAG: DUF3048 domain-containing protein [Lachnospiraceae bacterium]|nr:DUF3048 domain-containing protein [Lachnospiraceae bacterium]